MDTSHEIKGKWSDIKVNSLTFKYVCMKSHTNTDSNSEYKSDMDFSMWESIEITIFVVTAFL